MAVLIDSNVLIRFEKQETPIHEKIKGREKESLFIFVITTSELLHGVYRATSQRIKTKRLAFVEAVLEHYPMLELDLATARTHAQLWSTLTSQGKMIGLHDSWIVATCLTHGLILVTYNTKEFQRIPGLQVEQW